MHIPNPIQHIASTKPEFQATVAREPQAVDLILQGQSSQRSTSLNIDLNL